MNYCIGYPYKEYWGCKFLSDLSFEFDAVWVQCVQAKSAFPVIITQSGYCFHLILWTQAVVTLKPAYVSRHMVYCKSVWCIITYTTMVVIINKEVTMAPPVSDMCTYLLDLSLKMCSVLNSFICFCKIHVITVREGMLLLILFATEKYYDPNNVFYICSTNIFLL
jgi:hypothetical protein